jgi:large subunit ribosomal protein L15
MKIHELKKTRSDSKSLRVGRGISAGGGKTAGRGTKGQKSRSGYNIPRKFEGGQTPLNMRLHKLSGFRSFAPNNKIITLSDISKNFKDGETVSEKTLESKGLINKGETAKILASGELTVQVVLSGVKRSKNVDLKLPKNTKNSK